MAQRAPRAGHVSSLLAHDISGRQVQGLQILPRQAVRCQKYGTYVIRALKDSPERKIHIGKEASTLYLPVAGAEDETSLITYEVPRACATCATGNCHDGKESFSRLECLMCHRSR